MTKDERRLTEEQIIDWFSSFVVRLLSNLDLFLTLRELDFDLGLIRYSVEEVHRCGWTIIG